MPLVPRAASGVDREIVKRLRRTPIAPVLETPEATRVFIPSGIVRAL